MSDESSDPSAPRISATEILQLFIEHAPAAIDLLITEVELSKIQRFGLSFGKFWLNFT